MVYQWKTREYKVDAQAAGEELERISGVHSLTPETIVNESTPKESPLHEIFEWNNEKAGHEWRKQQARVMIGNLVTVQIEEQEVEPVRAFINVAGEENEYAPIEVVVRNQELYDRYVMQALRELESYKKKYRDIMELKKHFDDLDRFSSNVKAGLEMKGATA
jgi:Cu/Ag efflux pump CusA